MSSALSFIIMVAVTLLLAWVAEEILPRRPTGGLKGLTVLGLVSGFMCGWVGNQIGLSLGPAPGGVSLGIGLFGSAISILIASLWTVMRSLTPD